MSEKRQRGTQGRGAPWILAVRLLTALVHFMSKLLRKLPYEQIAALGDKENEAKLDRMIEAVALINSGKTLVSSDGVKPAPPTPVVNPPRLKLLEGTTIVPAFEKFVARYHCREDGKTKVKIYYLGENFKKNFLKKIEVDVEKAELRRHILLRSSLDPEIMAELGEDRRTVKLAHFWAMLEKQANGEQGDLLVNGYANIAYVEDENGIVWAVIAYWNSGRGWRVEADSVGDPDGWYDGYRVLSL